MFNEIKIYGTFRKAYQNNSNNLIIILIAYANKSYLFADSLVKNL